MFNVVSPSLIRLTLMTTLLACAILFVGCTNVTPLQQEFYHSGRTSDSLLSSLFGGSYTALVNPMSPAEARCNIENSLLPDEAVVIITRPKDAVHSEAATVISEGLDNPQYVGVTQGGIKLLYKTKAGTKYFCSTNTNGKTDVVKVTLAPRKYYYLNLSASRDPLNPVITFDHPASATADQITAHLKSTSWRIANINGFTFFENVRDYIKKQSVSGLTEWEQSGGTKTLTAEQGYDTLLEERDH